MLRAIASDGEDVAVTRERACVTRETMLRPSRLRSTAPIVSPRSRCAAGRVAGERPAPRLRSAGAEPLLEQEGGAARRAEARRTRSRCRAPVGLAASTAKKRVPHAAPAQLGALLQHQRAADAAAAPRPAHEELSHVASAPASPWPRCRPPPRRRPRRRARGRGRGPRGRSGTASHSSRSVSAGP